MSNWDVGALIKLLLPHSRACKVNPIDPVTAEDCGGNSFDKHAKIKSACLHSKYLVS